jgi:hypothetical protein
MDLLPLILIEEEAPGEPEELVITRPAALELRALIKYSSRE